MKKQRAIPLVLSSAVVVAATSWWALQREQAPAPASGEAAVGAHELEHPAMAPPADDAPALVELERPAGEPGSTPSTPLDRQRDRLRDTAARLATRRDQAQASHAPEPTVRALEAHLARVEQRLAELDATFAAGVTGTGASPSVTTAG